MNGFVLGMHCIGLLHRTPVTGKTRVHQIKGVNSDLVDKAKTYFTTYVSQHVEGDAEKAEWLAKLERVEKLFAD